MSSDRPPDWKTIERGEKMRSKAGRVAGVLRYPISATAAEKPLPRKGRESFPSWTSPVRPRSPALRKLLRHVGRDIERPQALDEVAIVVVLVAPHRRPIAAGDLLRHRSGGFPFRAARGAGEARVDHEPVPILDQHVPLVG